MNLANMPPPEPFAFDAEKAVGCPNAAVHRMRQQLEDLCKLHPGRLRYAIGCILAQPDWMFSSVHVQAFWAGFAYDIFNGAIAAGHPDACAIAGIKELARWHAATEKRRKKAERLEKNLATFRSPERAEARRAAARKASATRTRKKTELTRANTALSEADDVFASVVAMTQALSEQPDKPRKNVA